MLLVKTPPWDTRLPPLGIGYLDAYLKKHGIDSQIWDCNIDTYLRFRMDREELWDMEAAVFWFTPERVAEVFNHEADIVARKIVEADTPYVGFSLTMEGIQFAKLVTDRLRRDAPGTAHTAAPEIMLRYGSCLCLLGILSVAFVFLSDSFLSPLFPFCVSFSSLFKKSK